MFVNAEGYESFMGRWSRQLAPRFVKFAPIADGSRILDVGCGTGALSAEIARQSPHCQITGIDLSPEFVAYANSCAQRSNVNFQVGNAQSLDFPDEQFDACLSQLVFNFFPDRRKALNELQRVTRRGGHICATVWDYHDGMKLLRIFCDAAVSLDPGIEKTDEKYMPLCRAGELGELWREAGLVDVEEQAIGFAMRFESFDDYWRPFLAGQGPAGVYVSRLSLEGRNALRDEIARRLPSTGAFELDARAWAVRGTRR